MEIKTLNKEPIEVNIREWNDSVRAFIKPLNGIELLLINDLIIDYYNKDSTPEARFMAGFKAALMVLIDENNNPLLSESDETVIRSASFVPFSSIFAKIIETNKNDGAELESFKKN